MASGEGISIQRVPIQTRLARVPQPSEELIVANDAHSTCTRRSVLVGRLGFEPSTGRDRRCDRGSSAEADLAANEARSALVVVVVERRYNAAVRLSRITSL